MAVNRINIDPRVTGVVLKSPRYAALAKSIIGAAKNFDLTVCAKGVQTAGEFSVLRTVGSDEVQGDYFSPPLTAEQFASWYWQSRVPAPELPGYMARRNAVRRKAGTRMPIEAPPCRSTVEQRLSYCRPACFEMLCFHRFHGRSTCASTVALQARASPIVRYSTSPNEAAVI